MAYANKYNINMFRKEVLERVRKITFLMGEVMELDRHYTDNLDTENGDSFFNNYLPIGDEYPFEKDWYEQITDLIIWGDKIVDLINEQK